MTLDEKVHRYLSETREQGVGGWTAAPPLIRLLWLLRLDVPPPFYWSFAAVAVLSGCFFAFFVFCIEVFVFGESWRRQAVGAVIGGVFFGLVMAWYTQRKSRRLRLSPWDGRAAGDV
jgi:hypothetical protein